MIGLLCPLFFIFVNMCVPQVKPPWQHQNRFYSCFKYLECIAKSSVVHSNSLLLLEELTNITCSCFLTLTVGQNLVRSNQLNVSHFVIQRQLLPSHSPEIPCRPSKGVPSVHLRLVEMIHFA